MVSSIDIVVPSEQKPSKRRARLKLAKRRREALLHNTSEAQSLSHKTSWKRSCPSPSSATARTCSNPDTSEQRMITKRKRVIMTSSEDENDDVIQVDTKYLSNNTMHQNNTST